MVCLSVSEMSMCASFNTCLLCILRAFKYNENERTTYARQGKTKGKTKGKPSWVTEQHIHYHPPIDKEDSVPVRTLYSCCLISCVSTG